MTDATQATDTTQDSKPASLAASLFQNGTAQVGGMVTSIVLVGQAFGRLGIHTAAAPVAAFVFSALLAVYQVAILQKTPRSDCYVLIPIATLILFALALGGTNSLAPDREREDLRNELELTKQELAIRTKEFENANAFIDRLVQRTGLREEGTGNATDTPHAYPKVPQSWADTLVGFVVPDAAAQQNEQQRERRPEPAQGAGMQGEYQRFRQHQKALEQQQREIEEQRDRLQRQQEQEQRKGAGSFWKIW